MTIQAQTARSFDARDGFDLVDFVEVGLPIFRLTVEAVTLARQEMPTTHEFALRAISLGERQASGIAHLLGLSDEDILDALQLLRLDRCVDVIPATGDEDDAAPDSYQITELGDELLKGAERTPRDEILVFDFDGIRRRPVTLGSESVLRPKDLAERGAIQVRPYPAEPPDASQLVINDVARVVRRLSGKEFARGVLAIRRIVRRDNLFRPAIGLLFRSRTTSEAQIGFVLGDQVAEDYEIEFARHGGAKKPGLIRTSAEADGRSALRHLLGPDLFAKLADPEEVSRRRLAVTLASRDRAALGAKLERLRRRPKFKTAEGDELPAIEERLSSARKKLEELELRPLAPYEHWELFNEALDSAQKRLFITSADIDADVTHSFILRRLDERLDEGVEIRIETSVLLGPQSRGRAGSFEPGVELWLRGQQKRGLTLAERPARTADLYFLIKDDDLAIISNRPFLSGREQPLSFVPTVGVVTQHPVVVADIARLAEADRSGASDRGV